MQSQCVTCEHAKGTRAPQGHTREGVDCVHIQSVPERVMDTHSLTLYFFPHLPQPEHLSPPFGVYLFHSRFLPSSELFLANVPKPALEGITIKALSKRAI